jgi:hypothetical protein
MDDGLPLSGGTALVSAEFTRDVFMEIYIGLAEEP